VKINTTNPAIEATTRNRGSNKKSSNTAAKIWSGVQASSAFPRRHIRTTGRFGKHLQQPSDGAVFSRLIAAHLLLVMLATEPCIRQSTPRRESVRFDLGNRHDSRTPRSNVLIAKYLYVATMSFTAGLLNLMAMMFSLRAMLAPIFRRNGADLAISIPMESIPIILLGAC